jgi:Na+-driven multidrug efflux pump
MTVQLSGAITNIILDPILIFGYLGLPAMGIRGAAVATVIGQAVSAVLGIILNLKCNTEIKILLKNFIPKFDVIRDMLAIGIPAVLMQAIGSVMTFSMNLIMTSFPDVGNVALNVFGIYFKLQSFVFMPVFGLNNGMVTIISYNYGACKKKRIYGVMRVAVIAAVSYMLLGFTVFQFLHATLLGFFNASDAMLEIGKHALKVISISFIMAGFSVVSISVCQALGKSIYSLIVSIVRQLVILIPSAYLLSLSGNINLVWWAFPIAELFGCSLCVTFLIIILKKIVNKLPDAPSPKLN